MYTVTITNQGQVTVPVKLRKSLGVKGGDKLNIIVDGKKIYLSKATGWDTLRGILSKHKGNYPTSKQLAQAHVLVKKSKDAKNTGRHQHFAAVSY